MAVVVGSFGPDAGSYYRDAPKLWSVQVLSVDELTPGRRDLVMAQDEQLSYFPAFGVDGGLVSQEPHVQALPGGVVARRLVTGQFTSSGPRRVWLVTGDGQFVCYEPQAAFLARCP
jgi:hypothetical protein